MNKLTMQIIKPHMISYRVNKFARTLLIVLVKDDILLKSTMESGKLFQIRAIHSVKKMTFYI